MGDDELIAMIVLVPLAILGTFVALLFGFFGLRRRLDRAEQRWPSLPCSCRPSPRGLARP